MNQWFSNASWTKIPDSQDDHETEEHAKMVCMLLKEDYGKGVAGAKECSIRGWCTKAWVTSEEEYN